MRKEPKDRYHCFLYEDIVGKMRMAQVLFFIESDSWICIFQHPEAVFCHGDIHIIDLNTAWRFSKNRILEKYLLLTCFENIIHFIRVLKSLKGFYKRFLGILKRSKKPAFSLKFSRFSGAPLISSWTTSKGAQDF